MNDENKESEEKSRIDILLILFVLSFLPGIYITINLVSSWNDGIEFFIVFALFFIMIPLLILCFIYQLFYIIRAIVLKVRKKNKKMEKKTMERTEEGFIKIDIKNLIEWNEPNGEGCMVSDKITKEGWKVGYMYRDEVNPNNPDSGWTFLKGDESDEYMNNPDNFHIFAINTICNYDPDIIPYIHSEVGSSFIRIGKNKFEKDNRTKEIYMEKQDIMKDVETEENKKQH